MSEFYIEFDFGNNTCNWVRTHAKFGSPDDYATLEPPTWLCMGCHHPKPGVRGVDAHIMDERLDGQLNCVWGFGLPLALKSFLLQFGEERVRRHLYLGKVFGPNGELFEDWVTFRGKHGLIVRGTQDAGYRVCDQCGRNVYAAGPKRYLCPAPHEGIELFESDGCGLIVPELIVKDLGMGKVPGVHRTKLPVLSKPLDNLPPLSFYDSGFQRPR